MNKLAMIALFSTLATGVFAHSSVTTTQPANGDVLAEVPAEISFTFAKGIRLTRAEMGHLDQPAIRLDLGDQTSFDLLFTVPLQEMGKGTYRIDWRGLGEDGHAVQGTFTFTVE